MRRLAVIAPRGVDLPFSCGTKSWFGHGRAGLHRAERRLSMQPLWAHAPRHDCNVVISVSTARLGVLEERHAAGRPPMSPGTWAPAVISNRAEMSVDESPCQ